MNRFIKILKWIFYPSPLKLGLLITGLFTFYSTHYYIMKESGRESQSSNFILSFVQDLHLKTIDYKLRIRGERETHPDIAIITVDERAIDHLGRWPWPRDRIANIIDILMSNGAKAIAFDIVFSEEDKNEKLLLLNEVKKNKFKDPKIYQVLNDKINRVNTDNRLTETIEKWSDHLIMGGFFETVDYRLLGPNQKCANLITNKQYGYEFLEYQELQVGVLDDTEFYLPDRLIPFLEKNLISIALKTKSQNPNMNPIDLRTLIRNNQFLYCAKWLHPQDDVSLMELKALFENDLASKEKWKSASFEDFLLYLYSIPANPLRNIKTLTLNIDKYNEATKHFGYFNAFPDEDGTLRKTSLISRIGDMIAPSLAFKTAMLVKNAGAFVKMQKNPVDPSMKMVSDLQFMDLNTGEFKEQIPVNQKGFLKINYAGPQKMFPYLSVTELFNNKKTAVIEQRYKGDEKKYTVQKSDWIKDKIFIFGVTAVGVFDLRVTPFEEIYPGVETHANIIDNLLRDDFLFEKRGENSKMFLFIIVLGVLTSFVVTKFGALIGLFYSFIAIGLSLYTDYHYFFLEGIILNIILPVLLLLGLYFFLTIYKYFTEERTKRELKGTFQKYVSPAIVDEVLKDAKNIELGGKKIEMSVLFSDIRGFTTLSEKLDPQKLSNFLNSYLTPMTELVFENKGTLDKYMGDAVMAFFGAPIQYNNHAYMACKCALEMMDKLHDLQKEYEKEGLPPIDIGIGINTGEMCVGNMGSETVRSYTVMGDAVNLGSRLEGINKEYATNIIISEFTFKKVEEQVVAREVDRVQVKGKLEPVRIYELAGLKECFKDTTMLEVIDLFKKGYSKYMEKDFESAISLFEKALAIKEDDGPSLLFLSRAKVYHENPPQEDWDGVFIMNTK